MINQNNLVYEKNNNLRDHQKITISEIYKKVKYKKNLKFLDVGCATGNLIFNLKKLLNNNLNCYEAIEVDKKIIKDNGLIFNKIYFEEYTQFLKVNKTKYDVVVLSGIICFFKDPMKIIKKSFSLLKRGGMLIIFDRFTEQADVQIIHSFRNDKKKYSTYNATSIYKLKTFKKKKKFKNFEIINFNLKKKLKKNYNNLWQSYTKGTNNNKIILNHIDIIYNFYHVVITKC